MSCDCVSLCSGGYKQSGSLLCRLCCLKATPSCRYHCVCTLSTSTPTSFLQATHSSRSVVAAIHQWMIKLVAMKRLACCSISMPALVCSTVHTTFKRSALPGVGEHIADNVIASSPHYCSQQQVLHEDAVTTINASAANATRSTTINATTAAASTATTSAANAIATINAASAGTAAATTATAAIDGVETHVNGVLERVKVKTVGIKNMDVRELKGVPLPRALFNTKNLKTKQ
eukprot:2016-Heterococcus_DN1.PRE.1